MFERTVSPDDLDRLYRERKAADRAYNDALTRLDEAIRPLRELPAPAPAAPAEQPPALADGGDLSLANQGSPESGWRRWVRGLIASVVGPALERQAAFNRTAVEHLERLAAARRDEREAAERLAAFLREEVGALATFQSRLVQYVQQITPYVDTKDREVAGLMRRVSEDNTVEAEKLALRVDGTGAGLEAAAGPAAMPPAEEDDASAYVGFEDVFRGGHDDIVERQRAYLPYFEGATDVLDLGCGRGEFLELLREQGIGARGIDTNPEMVARCVERGLDVTRSDALGHLRGLPEASIGGLFSAQVVEPRAPLPHAAARSDAPRAASGRPSRGRDHQPGVLGRVLQRLPAGRHPPPAAASRHVAASAAGRRIRLGRGRLPLAGSRGRPAAAHSGKPDGIRLLRKYAVAKTHPTAHDGRVAKLAAVHALLATLGL